MPRALIVGAGIGGLAAGLALHRIGWDVEIFERAEAPRELGFGIGLAPNAMAALRELGVAKAVLAHTVTWNSPTTVEIRQVGGRVLRRFQGDPATLPSALDSMRLIMRPALHGELLDAVGRDVVRVNHEVVGFESSGDGVRLRFQNGDMASGDVIVGADGFHSAIRSQLHPEECPSRPSGYYALRGAASRVDALGDLQAIWYFGTGVESGIVQAGPNAVYWFLSLFVDDERQAGAGSAEEVLRRWSPRFDSQFRAITGSSEIRLDELFERDPLARWGSGTVTLLGDAAHPMLPHTGQGGAQALEDAVALGRALRDTSDTVTALRRYEEVRRRRTTAIVKSGPRIARITTSRSRTIGALRNAVVRVIPMGLIVKGMVRPAADPNRELGPPLGGLQSTAHVGAGHRTRKRATKRFPL
ncbi:MAG TPA: FAD-dependent monooxygenase [Vicinamibacterales bacterium]|nr:FAD-dependent monooxygenase [Vicinamibacterales bacterium]